MSAIRHPERSAADQIRPDRPLALPTTIAGVSATTLAVVLFAVHGIAQGTRFVVALSLGVALHHARLGFTLAFR